MSVSIDSRAQSQPASSQGQGRSADIPWSCSCMPRAPRGPAGGRCAPWARGRPQPRGSAYCGPPGRHGPTTKRGLQRPGPPGQPRSLTWCTVGVIWRENRVRKRLVAAARRPKGVFPGRRVDGRPKSTFLAVRTQLSTKRAHTGVVRLHFTPAFWHAMHLGPRALCAAAEGPDDSGAWDEGGGVPPAAAVGADGGVPPAPVQLSIARRAVWGAVKCLNGQITVNFVLRDRPPRASGRWQAATG